MTASNPPVREFLRKRRLFAPDRDPALTISPSGNFTFAAAVM
jgi:hypothetical protein